VPLLHQLDRLLGLLQVLLQGVVLLAVEHSRHLGDVPLGVGVQDYLPLSRPHGHAHGRVLDFLMLVALLLFELFDQALLSCPAIDAQLLHGFFLDLRRRGQGPES